MRTIHSGHVIRMRRPYMSLQSVYEAMHQVYAQAYATMVSPMKYTIATRICVKRRTIFWTVWWVSPLPSKHTTNGLCSSQEKWVESGLLKQKWRSFTLIYSLPTIHPICLYWALDQKPASLCDIDIYAQEQMRLPRMHLYSTICGRRNKGILASNG